MRGGFKDGKDGDDDMVDARWVTMSVATYCCAYAFPWTVSVPVDDRDPDRCATEQA